MGMDDREPAYDEWLQVRRPTCVAVERAELSRLQTLGIKELRVQFSNEDEALNDAIESAKKTIETLKKEVAKCPESSSVGKKQLGAKIDFLKAQIDLITTFRELLSAQVAKCLTLPRSHDRDEETKATLREIIKLFRTFTQSLNMMRRAHSAFYLTMLEDLRTWLGTHKLGLFAGLVGGTVVGGLGGWAAGVSIAEGIATVTAIGAEISGGLAVSVAMGAAAVAVLLVGALGLFLLYKHFNPNPDAAEAQHRKKIEAMLKVLEKIPLTAQGIAELREAYQQMFASARMPSGLHECLVCQEELRSCEDDVGDHHHTDQCAVSAPGCKHHFAHRVCYTEWAMTSGRKECMVCSTR